MPKDQDKNIVKPTPKYPTTLTNLPGLEGVPVIISTPSIVKETSSKPGNK